MKELKLVSILKTFSKDDLKEFEKFIISPFHNKGRNFKPLFSYLKKYHPVFPEEKVSLEKIFYKLYSGKIYDKTKSSLNVRVLFSQLAQIAEEFTLIKELYDQNNTLIRNTLKFNAGFKNKALRSYSERALKDNLHYLQNRIESFFESDMHIKTNENLIELKVIAADYDSIIEIKEQNILYSLNSTFDMLYLIAASDLVLRQRVNKGIKGTGYFRHFVNNIDLKSIEEYIYCDNKGTKDIIRFNFCLARFILNNNFDDTGPIDEAIDCYKKLFSILPFEHKHSLFMRLSNVLIMGSHRDTELYGYKVHLLSSFILENNCYSEKDGEMMNGMSYLNIFLNKEYFLNAEEMGKFISDNLKYVDTHSRNNVENLSRICYCIKSGQFEKGLDILSRLSTGETMYKIIIYRYKLMLLYELKLFEELISYIDSFEHYLRNNRLLNEFMREMYTALCKALKLLIRIKLNPGEKIFDELDLAVDKCRNKVFYRWVLEKSNELKGEK